MTIQAGQIIEDGGVKWRVRDLKSGGGVGTGTIMPFLATQVQPGWLACDTGALVSRATYPDLWAWVQTNAPLITEAEWQAQAAAQSSVGYYSSGDGSTTFRLPRLLDYPRGGLAADVGKWQGDAIRNITGYFPCDNAQGAYVGGAFSVPSHSYGPGYPEATTGEVGYKVSFDASSQVPTADENRPKTIKFLYCVKAFDAITDQGLIDITELANEMVGKVNQVDYVADHVHNLAANGYQKLPSGLILQWGYAKSTTVSEITTVVLPVAFPTAFFSVTVSQNYNHAGQPQANPYVSIIDNSSFKANMEASVANVGFYYMAAGC